MEWGPSGLPQYPGFQAVIRREWMARSCLPGKVQKHHFCDMTKFCCAGAQKIPRSLPNLTLDKWNAAALEQDKAPPSR
ncbi:unnamed protein product [Caretta caretta]